MLRQEVEKVAVAASTETTEAKEAIVVEDQGVAVEEMAAKAVIQETAAASKLVAEEISQEELTAVAVAQIVVAETQVPADKNLKPYQ